MGFVAVNGYDTDWATVCLNPFVKVRAVHLDALTCHSVLGISQEGGVVCCLQNGVNDHRIAKIVGQPRTLGLVMTISAAMYAITSQIPKCSRFDHTFADMTPESHSALI